MPGCRVIKKPQTLFGETLKMSFLQIYIIFWGRRRRHSYAPFTDEETKNQPRLFPELVLFFHQQFSAWPDTAPRRRMINSSHPSKQQASQPIISLLPSISKSHQKNVCVPMCVWPYMSIHVCTSMYVTNLTNHSFFLIVTIFWHPQRCSSSTSIYDKLYWK